MRARIREMPERPEPNVGIIKTDKMFGILLPALEDNLYPKIIKSVGGFACLPWHREIQKIIGPIMDIPGQNNNLPASWRMIMIDTGRRSPPASLRGAARSQAGQNKDAPHAFWTDPNYPTDIITLWKSLG